MVSSAPVSSPTATIWTTMPGNASGSVLLGALRALPAPEAPDDADHDRDRDVGLARDQVREAHGHLRDRRQLPAEVLEDALEHGDEERDERNDDDRREREDHDRVDHRRLD